MSTSPSSRRRFLAGGAAIAGTALTHKLGWARTVHQGVNEVLNVGLIGCGGRGTGACVNACNADANVRITALADPFADRIEHCRRNLSREIGQRLQVDDEHCFKDFDGYKRLIESDVDVVLMCSPPHFRPLQMDAAVDAGKHIFCEKPIAVDAPGVRQVSAACERASDRGLSVVSGLCWRYDVPVNEVMKRIKDGAIGDILTIQENYLTGTLWHRGNNPSWSQMEYQLRNWLYFTWLSGDHIVEQHIHSLDKALWLMDDQPPASCYGIGGRQVRTDPMWGNVYDHFACCFQWPNGVKTFAYTRQMAGCMNDTDDYVVGTRGSAQILRNTIENNEGKWRYSGPESSMYDVEHEQLFRSIRQGDPINNGDYMCKSTLMAIMGREACYTGQEIQWEDLWNSPLKLGPDRYQWGDVEGGMVAMPG